MANEALEGIVLRVRKHKERDFILTFLTPDYGKLPLYLRGAKKPDWSSKKLTFPFTRGIVITDYKESGLLFVKGSQRLVSPLTLFSDISKNAYGNYLGQLVDAATEERLADPELYGQVVQAIDLIEAGLDEAIVTNIMEVRLLDYFGVQPSWAACVVCGETQGPFDYSPKYKGLLCRSHGHLDMHRYQADPKAIHLIRVFSQTSLQQVSSIQVSQGTKQEIRRVLDLLYEDLVGVRPKAKSFIDQMHQWDHVFDENENESVDK